LEIQQDELKAISYTGQSVATQANHIPYSIMIVYYKLADYRLKKLEDIGRYTQIPPEGLAEIRNRYIVGR